MTSPTRENLYWDNMKNQVERKEISGLNKRLDRLEKSLNRMRVFLGKGGTIEHSLSEIYSDLIEIGNMLTEIQKHNRSDLKEMELLTARHRGLLDDFESLSDDVNRQNKGMVLSSSRTIPDFLYNITRRYRKMWKIFEYISAASGIAIILFTLVSITYYCAYGVLPLISQNVTVPPLIKAFGFISGLFAGLFVHEFAHGIVLANNGIKIKEVGAMAGSMIGGFIEADEETFIQADKTVHLRFNASSIGTNGLLAVILIIISVTVSSHFLLYLALGNLFFGVINSFPVRPLDGGWVYEDIANIYIENKMLKQVFLSLRYVVVFLWLVIFSYSAISFH